MLLHGTVLPEYDVPPSVRPSVRLSGVTLMYADHNKLIERYYAIN